MLCYKPYPSQVRSLNRKEFLKTKENNLEKVREMNKNAKIRKRFMSSQLQLTMSYYCQLGKKNFTVADGTHEMNMANVIQSFHDSFALCNPEYICTCCDQLWY